GRGPLVRRPPRRARRRGAADRRRARRTGGAPPARCRPRTARAGGPARGAGRCLPRPHPSRPRRGRLMDTTLPLPAPLRACLVETRCELMRMWREPAYSIPVLGFPAMFYLLFAVLLNRGNPAAADYLLATYGVFGVVGAALFGFGVTIAMDRERGYLRLRRVLPAAPGAMLLARMAMAMLFAALISVLLATLSAALAGVRLAPSQWLALALVNVAGVLPFAAIGLWVGSMIGGNAAPALLNALYLPMAFLSGLWLPLSMLPD